MMHDFDLTGCLPFDRDANGDRPAVLGAPGPFLYLGQGLDAAAFTDYVRSYNFGRIAPSYIVLHHTAIPSTLAARYPSGAVWDAGEADMSDARIYAKRKRQLDALATYYHDSLGWSAGPHLFIDERYIWLFTPMSAVGVHAKAGNSYGAGAQLRYSIGIEIIGYYEHTVWPDAVAANVRTAVHALCTRLGISPAYRPGPLHTPAAHDRSLSSHRDYGKPQCPGAAITEAYYVGAISAVSPPPLTKRYKARRIMISQRPEFGPPWAGELQPGEEVVIDKQYVVSRTGHLSDGRGFVRLSDIEAIS